MPHRIEPTEREINEQHDRFMQDYIAKAGEECITQADEPVIETLRTLLGELHSSTHRTPDEARALADRVAGFLYAQVMAHFSDAVDEDVQAWIAEYPTLMLIDEGERAFDARRDLDDTIRSIALQR